jgi:hypothetical protein
MDIITHIKGKLERYPALHYTAGDDFIRLDAPVPGGFGVTVENKEGRIKVAFDGWYDIFTTTQDALDCFDFAFSELCRIRVASRGQIDCAWSLEYLVDGEWEHDSTVHRALVPFWRKESVRYLQNVRPKAPGEVPRNKA